MDEPGARMTITIRNPRLEAARDVTTAVRETMEAQGWITTRMRALHERHGAVAFTIWMQLPPPRPEAQPMRPRRYAYERTGHPYAAERTGHPNAAEDPWAIIYDPTPGGRDNGDGTRSFSQRFPILLLTDYVAEPEKVAGAVADALNEAQAREDARSEVPA